MDPDPSWRPSAPLPLNSLSAYPLHPAQPRRRPLT